MIDDALELTSVVDQFRRAMLEKGIEPPIAITTDGNFHRFSTNGRPDGSAGWYVFNEGAIPTGAFGDDRTGIKVSSWKAEINHTLSPAETLSYRQQQEVLRAEKAAKKLRSQAFAKERANAIMAVTVPAKDTHPYLVRKGIRAHGIAQWINVFASLVNDKETSELRLQLMSQDGSVQLRFKAELAGKSPESYCDAWKDILVIPMMDESGEIQSLQLISKNGDKKFLAGGKMQGCYFPIGGPKDGEIILITEGYATAATIYETSRYPTIVAYNAGNLKAVAETIRTQYPNASIYLCADDDYKTAGNPGIIKAAEAAQGINGGVIVPHFGANRPDKATDFNDMAAHLGKKAVAQFFIDCFSGSNKNTIIYTDPIAPQDEEGEAIFVRPNGKMPVPTPSGITDSDMTNPGITHPASVAPAPTPKEVITGRIIQHGAAPYKHDVKNKGSYFIDVDAGDTTRRIWGIDLKDALQQSGLRVNDEAAIHNNGKIQVDVMAKIRDEHGKIIKETPRKAMKGSWTIEPLADYVERQIQPEIEQAYPAHTQADYHNESGPETARRTEPLPLNPVAEVKKHFSDEEFEAVSQIWKIVPRQVTQHSENSYELILDKNRKVTVTRSHIELAKKPRHRPDTAYKAACEHARLFWNGEMEVHGDNSHRIKAFAYATAYGVKVTNYKPSDFELIEVEKILTSLRKEMEPTFRRTNATQNVTAAQRAALNV